MLRLQLSSPRLILRTLPESEAVAVANYWERNAAFFQPWSPAYPPDFFTLDYATDWLRSQWQAMGRGELLRLFLFHESDGRFQRVLGDISFTQIQRGVAQSCFLGYKIDERFQGYGLMTEALRTAIAYIFDIQGLHRIEANIMPRNLASIRVVQKLGFRHEGFSRKLLKINGVWEDHERYALLHETD